VYRHVSILAALLAFGRTLGLDGEIVAAFQQDGRSHPIIVAMCNQLPAGCY